MKLTEEEMNTISILNEIIDQYKSIREFARSIDEDPADIFRWRAGKRKISPRAVVSIVKHHPDVNPHDLNPAVFEDGLKFTFNGVQPHGAKSQKTSYKGRTI